MLIPFLQNFNVEEYFRTHADDWGTRPVKVIWESSDYITLLVRGPSMGKEFHVGCGDEIFYQIEGELDFHYVTENGDRKRIHLKKGESFLLPGHTPHSPRRPNESSWTLVVERRPRPEDEDYWMWFCERCNHKVYESAHRLGTGPGNEPNTIVRDALSILRGDEKLRTCTKCGEILALNN